MVSQVNLAQAENQPLSPLASPASNQPKTETSPVYSLEYYLHLSKSFLYKAVRLANDNPRQTDADKMKILNTVNKALKAANQACQYYPRQPEAYLIRAQVYQKMAHLFPEGKKQAEKDIKTANQLMKKPDLADIPREKEAQPLNFIPTQKANLAKKIIIAEPKASQEPEAQNSELNINAASGTAILEAGKTEIIVKTNQVKPGTQVYLVPKGGADNKVLSVVAKKDYQWFKAGINSASDKDIIFNWWIIN